jgi:hypothetical protein
MAEILLKYYKYVAGVQGLQGKMMLAKITKIPSTKAALELDTAQNIMLFKKLLKRLQRNLHRIYDISASADNRRVW